MSNKTRNTLALAILVFACMGTAQAQTAGPDGIIRVRSD